MPRVKNIDGVNYPFTPEEEAAQDAIDAEWAAGATDRAMASLRSERNTRLAETDWWASSDLTMSSARTQYRIDLRNLPATVDISKWPNITWPTKPS